MLVCNRCSFRCEKRLQLIKHEFETHCFEPTFSTICGIKGCLYSFKVGSTYSSFKTHANRKHPNWQVEVETTVTYHDNPLEPPAPCSIDPTEDPLASSESSPPINDTPSASSSALIDNDFSSLDGDVVNGRYSIDHTAALFLLTFKERYMLPQAAINFAVGAVNGIVTSACESVRQSLLTNTDLPTDKISSYLELEDPFASLQTEYQQTRFYCQVFGMVVSVHLVKDNCLFTSKL